MTTETRDASTARVVIIGAGASGLAAATRLLNAGFRQVIILEAENRVGGRINTVPFADNVVNFGAQWCHGEKGNVVYQMVKDKAVFGPTGDAFNNNLCVRSNREILPNNVADVLKTAVATSTPERKEGSVAFDGSLGDYITKGFWNELAKSPKVDKSIAVEFLENFKKYESSVVASENLFEISGNGYKEFWPCEGEQMYNWRDKGYKEFLNILTSTTLDINKLENQNIIRLNKRIAQIDWRDPRQIQLRCLDGEVISADHVICTVSVGVLREYHRNIFMPELPPAKVRAIDGLQLGTTDKFYLEFEKPFGPEDATGFCFLWREEDLIKLRKSSLFWLEGVFGFYRVSYQPRVLQGWIIGAFARHMETLPEAEVLQGLLWLFRKFFDFPVAEPINFLRTQWQSNPSFCGSYSFRSITTDKLGTDAADLASPITSENGQPLLQFAGEATHSHYFATVHGAVETGWREADRLIAFYQKK